MLIAGDVYRPAAIDQLVILGKQVWSHFNKFDIISQWVFRVT